MKNMEHEFSKENEGRKLLKQLLVKQLQSPSDSFLRDYDEETILDAFVWELSPVQMELLNAQLEKWNALSKSEKDAELQEIRTELGSETSSNYERKKTEFSDENSSSDYIAQKIDDYLVDYAEKKERSGRAVPESTIKEYRGIFEEFLQIIGSNLKCHELNKQIIKDYVKAVWKMPSNHTKSSKYKDKTIPEILKLDVPKEDKRAPATFNKHALRVNQFLQWAEREDYIQGGLSDYIEKAQDSVDQNKKREAFKPEELKLLFNNAVYEKGKFKNPSRYWMPLLALFTGARAQELAQLYSDDIDQDKTTGIYFINIRENAERKQHLKRPSSSRIVPLHEKLIRLGFIDFVQGRGEKALLFPDLDRGDGPKQKGFTNNFNRKEESGWKWECGVKRKNTTFHSFRHNVVDFFAKSNVNERVSCAIVGHKY